jgi:spermidine/putrescine transport system substrate-binding protein
MSKSRQMSRRTFLRTSAVLGVGLVAAGCVVPTPTEAPSEVSEVSEPSEADIQGININYLGWEGYDWADALKPLTEPNDITVNSTYGGNNEEIFAKLKAGSEGQYDIVSIYHGTIAAMVENDLLQPIDTSRVEHWDDLLDSFKSQPWQVIDGNVYSVPFTWGNTPVAYNPEFVPDGIESWNDLKDEKFKDRLVIVDNSIQELYVALASIGVDLNKVITKDELEQAKEWYLPVKANARAIVPNYGEMADMLARKEAWITGGVWVAVVGWAAEKGVTLETLIPKEGTFGWCDNYVIPKGANLDGAYAFINQMTSPDGQKELALYLGQEMTNKNVVEMLPEDMQKAYEDVEANLQKTPFPPDAPQSSDDPNVATYPDFIDAWEEIKAS